MMRSKPAAHSSANSCLVVSHWTGRIFTACTVYRPWTEYCLL